MVPDLTFVVQIRLVRHDDNGEEVPVLDAQDLLVELGAADKRPENLSARAVERTLLERGCCSHLLKAAPAGDAVHQKEPFACPHVLFPHCAVLFLPSRVENVQERDLVVDDALLAVGICSGGTGEAQASVHSSSQAGHFAKRQAHLQSSGHTRRQSATG